MKKCISLLLAALLLLSPGAAASAEGAGGPQKGEVVVLGRWKDEPIRWLILDPEATNAGGAGVFLLCEKALTNQGVVYDWAKAVWQGSDGQRWCGELLASSFTEAEQAAIPRVSKSEEGFQQYGLNWGPVTLEEEQIFFISAKELGDYIGPNDGDAGLSAAYAGDGKTAYYWLRTPHGSHSDYAGLVIEGDQVHDFLVYGSWAARPAANLGGEGFVYLAPNEREPGLCDPGPMPASGNGEWKAVVVDPTLSLTLESAQFSGGELAVRYSGATEGAWLSVLARDAEGRNVSYACLGQAEVPEGELRFVPELPEGGSLYLFAEKDNGPDVSASASVLCPLSWEPPPTPTPEPTPIPTPEPPQETICEPDPSTPAPEESAPAEEENEGAETEKPVNAALQSTNWIFGILFAILSVAALVLAVRQARIRRIGRKRRIKADEEEDRE